MNWIKQNWLKMGIGLLVISALFLMDKPNGDYSFEPYINAQIVANRFFRENCKQEIPKEKAGHRLLSEMSFCISELKKVDYHVNFGDINPKTVPTTIIGEYQIKIKDSQFMDNGIVISVIKNGRIVSIEDDYESFEKDSEYPDYIYEIWEAKTGLGDRVIVLVTSRGGSWRGSEQLRAIYVDVDTDELIITPSVIVNDELTISSDKISQDDYKNALAKEVGNLMRLQLKSIK